jgi:hypothetical protein
MANDTPKTYFNSWQPQRCHPNAPAGGGGPGCFTSADPFQSGSLGWQGLPHPDSPAGRYLTPQEIRAPALTERVQTVVAAYFRALRLAPAAVYRETGYQLDQIIDGLLPGLLQMLAVLGISATAGAGAGAAIGFFLGGVSAAPGAVIGAELGLEIGTAVLTWMGLSFLAVVIGQGMGELTSVLMLAIRRAWHAPEHHYPQYETDRAAEDLARAVGILFRLILQGLLAYVLKNGAVSSSHAALSTGQTIARNGTRAGADATLAEVSALLRKSKLPDGFVVWLERNWDDLQRNPKLARQKATDTGNTATATSTAETPSQLKRVDKKADAPLEKNDAVVSKEKTSKKKLKPGSPEHKADRWQKYQERGGKKSYDQWGKQYDTNMLNYQYGAARESEYRAAMDASEGTLKTPLTNRQIDILKVEELYAGQLKTGPVSLTKVNILAIQKDAELVKRGWTVEHILEKGASKPYLEALEKAGIQSTIGPQIP